MARTEILQLTLTRVVALAALALIGRLALVAIPNVSLSYFVLFVAGVAFGPKVGASVGALSRAVGDLLLSGFHPIILAMVPVEALMGALFGLLGRWVDLGQWKDVPRAWAAGIAGAVGLLATFAFSIAWDSAGWVLFNAIAPSVPDSAQGIGWLALVVSGVLFNVPAALVNTVLFAAATFPVLRALRLNGLTPEPHARRRRPGSEDDRQGWRRKKWRRSIASRRGKPRQPVESERPGHEHSREAGAAASEDDDDD